MTPSSATPSAAAKTMRAAPALQSLAARALRNQPAHARHGKALLQHSFGAGLLLLALGLALLAAQPQLRADLEARALSWLLERQSVGLDAPAEPEADHPVALIDPALLPAEQQRVTAWLSRRYRVAQEPMAAIVAEAYEVGSELRLDPLLILAVMAKESRFNPIAASPVGAQGLMQVMTRVHMAKLEGFGGKQAVFDPLTNLRVGAMILRDTIRRGGSVEAGLRLYVGAVSTDASPYIRSVLAERERLQRAASGHSSGFMAASARSGAAAARARLSGEAMPAVAAVPDTGLDTAAQAYPAPAPAPAPAAPLVPDSSGYAPAAPPSA